MPERINAQLLPRMRWVRLEWVLCLLAARQTFLWSDGPETVEAVCDLWVDDAPCGEHSSAGQLFMDADHLDGRIRNSYVTRLSEFVGWDTFLGVIKNVASHFLGQERWEDQLEREARELSRDYSACEAAARSDLSSIGARWKNLHCVVSEAEMKTVGLLLQAGVALDTLVRGPIMRKIGRDGASFLVAASFSALVAHYSVPGFSLDLNESIMAACHWGAFLLLVARLGFYAWKFIGRKWRVWRNERGLTVVNAVMRANLCYFMVIVIAAFALCQSISVFVRNSVRFDASLIVML